MPNPTGNRLGASLGKGFNLVNVEKYTTMVHPIISGLCISTKCAYAARHVEYSQFVVSAHQGVPPNAMQNMHKPIHAPIN
jgi:hypothetical protein